MKARSEMNLLICVASNIHQDYWVNIAGLLGEEVPTPSTVPFPNVLAEVGGLMN